MDDRSAILSSLEKSERTAVEHRLNERQSGKCFICDEPIDLVLHEGQLEIDHVVPLADEGRDEENNFAIVHSSCNRAKGASDLRVARRTAEFERLQKQAQDRGARGANLGHVLAHYGGSRTLLRLKLSDGRVEYTLPETGSNNIQSVPLYKDTLSGMDYFFALFPLAYLHHDDRINPRSIGSNIRALIEEFMKKRPQLHVALAWWEPDATGCGPVKVFDGQHKAAAQILLGVKALPVRVFVNPDKNVLLQANTNAGDKLRQIAFDTAVMRHLGSTLYAERVRQYKTLKGLQENDYSFSEKDLVSFFRGEHREMQRYIIDAVRDSISYNKDNHLVEFIEWAGKTAEKPLSYSTIDRNFFKEFICKKALESRLDEGMEQGANPRFLEREQAVRLMSLFADVFFVGCWDPDIGGRQLETRLQKGDMIPEHHLRAWRIAREEVFATAMAWLRTVIENYYAWTGQMIDKERILQRRVPQELWSRLENFLRHVADLPCWVDKNLSRTVFGAKQNRDFWRIIFETGRAPSGVPVLAKPLDLREMIQDHPQTRGERSA